MVLAHFFDDFFVVEPAWSLQSAMFCFREGCKILGVMLDPQKSQFEEGATILGACFVFSEIRSRASQSVPKRQGYRA